MIIDGTKMACEACIRGHRVSGCNHHDRKLLPIAKKGRPVSQCNHCRSMRKSRSAHVKCDCGEKIAAQKEQMRNGIRPPSVEGAAAPGSRSGAGGSHTGADAPSGDDSKSCPCHHGKQCTCVSKKEPSHLDAVPEFSEPLGSQSCALPPAPQDVIRAAKPRLTTTHSESSLTTFLNGHHKPTHKHHISHGSHGSSPYHIPAIGHTGHNFGEHMGCTKSPPLSVVPISRRNKSEQSSPDLRVYPALNMPTNNITPLELTPHPPPSKPPMQHRATSRPHTVLSVNTNHHRPFSMHDYPTSGQDLLPSADSEFQFSAGLFPSQSAGWPNTFSTQFSTSASFEELSLETYEPYQCYNPPPPLTNSASGDEPEEVGPYSGPSPPYGFGSALSSNSSEHAESDNYHLSAASSYVALSQAAAAFPEFDRLLVTAAAYDNGPAGTEEMFVPYHSGATSGAFTEMGKLEEEAAGVQEDDFLWMGAGRW